MSRRYLGGLLSTSSPVATTSTASGLWTLQQQFVQRGQNAWPSTAPPALYAFTDATFTPGGATGSTGPTLAQARTGLTGTGVDAWKNNTAYFNTSGGIQLWTVPATGSYSFRVVGATGSNETETSLQVGQPADIRGTITLTEGAVLKILCGQTGWLGSSPPNSRGWGGGGGSFVTLNDNTPLFVAGGTGGPHTGIQPSATIYASLTTSGQISQSGTPPTGGAGGGGQGGGGAGITGNGTSLQSGTFPGVFGISFINGGTGGNRGGGFGGGGGCTNTYGGGAGGYSGGISGIDNPFSGGGGGSFLAASATSTSSQLFTNALTTMVVGFVTITRL